MKRLATLRSFLRAFLLRSHSEREMDREIRFHVESRAADLEKSGLAPAEAMRRARAEFGDVTRLKEDARGARGLRLVDDLVADISFAVRTMRRAPAFTAAACLSLALGIGGVTAVFGLLDLLFFKPLPVHNPHELVHVTMAGERGDAHSGSSNIPWYREVKARADLFTDALLERHDVFKVGINGQVEPTPGQSVTTNYFSVLGVPAALGRTFGPADSPEQGGGPVAIISYGLWQRRFGGSESVIGTPITVNRRPHTIVGVSPQGFHGLVVGWTMDVTVPLDPANYMEAANWSTMPLIARVKPGVDIATINAQLDPLLDRFANATAERFRLRYLDHMSTSSAAQGLSDLRAPFSQPLWLLMAAVGVLLLLACVNLAGLLVARNTARKHELALRVALGASRGRVLRQLLTEGAALTLFGALPGLLLGIYAGNVLLGFTPQYFGPISTTIAADWRVLAFVATTVLVTALLVGLLPAWQASTLGIAHSVNRGNRRAGTAGNHAGRALVVAQFALSLVLVAGTGLVLRSLVNLWQVELGFDKDHTLLVQIDPDGTDYEGDRLRTLQQNLVDSLALLPGVEAVSIATSTPFNGNVNGRRLTVPGFQPQGPDDGSVQANLVGPRYFAALQIPMLRGRSFDASDRLGSQPVAVVGQTFAARYFGGADRAIGRQFVLGGGPSALTHTIVGVANDVRYQSLRSESERIVYTPVLQDRDAEAQPFDIVVRVAGDPSSWIDTIRRELVREKPDAPIQSIHTMTDMIGRRIVSERLLATVGSFFATMALLLAAVGVYGLLAHLVSRRIPEIGVRMALGATRREMVWMMLREDLVLAGIGTAIGLGIAVYVLRALDSLLFGLSPDDVTTIAAAAVLLTLVSLAAAFVPARRAASVDPIIALRSE